MNQRLLLPLFLALPLTLVACGDKDDDTGHDHMHEADADTDSDTDSDTDADLANGESVFGDTCATCHGTTGDNGTAPNLYDVVPNHDEASLTTLLADGQGYMPAQEITGDDLTDVIAYTLDAFGG